MQPVCHCSGVSSSCTQQQPASGTSVAALQNRSGHARPRVCESSRSGAYASVHHLGRLPGQSTPMEPGTDRDRVATSPRSLRRRAEMCPIIITPRFAACHQLSRCEN
ncbi:hypothetical protein WA026_010285 [Henosepilachna vigintioctopunctata]|uniref:Uncharacterized protein n=1 Tax=Henosepilachna vigintioctopunctata TaxID=420089 RepID=A0AAW1U9U2_9CUCU